jgi:hypothetical protein
MKLDNECFQSILKKSNILYKNFIETGTCDGKTILRLAQSNKNLSFHTIEIVKELSNFAKSKSEKMNLSNINFYIGNTIDVLPNIISTIKDNIIFFLDAHSSGIKCNNIETLREESKEFKKLRKKLWTNKSVKMPIYKLSCDVNDNKLTTITVPLLDELNIINTFNYNFLIIIDDYTLFGKNNKNKPYAACGDWSNISIENIKNIFKNRLKRYYAKGHNMLILEIIKE